MSDDHPYPKFLDLEQRFPAVAGGGWKGFVRRAAERAMGLPEIRRTLAELAVRANHGEPPFEAFLDLNRMSLEAPGVVEAIPAEGPVMVIANHPFGGADALAVSAIATRARDDVKILANSELLALPGIDRHLFPLEILGGEGAERANLRVLRDALRHLKAGRALVVFPAGAVAHWQWGAARVEDPPWPLHTARLVKKSGAPVLPIRVFGRNGPVFELLGACHPLLRSALITRAFLTHRGQTMQCRAGELIESAGLPREPEALNRALREAVEQVLPGEGN